MRKSARVLSRLETIFAFPFLAALALAWLYPDSGLAVQTLLALAVLGTPFFILPFGRNLYTAAKLGYVIPDWRVGPVHRADSPVTFWSNVVLSIVLIPVLIAGAILLAGEALRLGAQLL